MKPNPKANILALIVLFLSQSCQRNEIKPPSFLQLLVLNTSPSSIGVVTSDFGGGGRFKLFETNALVSLPGSTPIHSDAVARYFDNKVYIVNRLGRDTIQRLNPFLNYATEQEFSVGQGRNPQDILVISPSKAYISFYNGSKLGIFDPSLGQEIGSIDLSAFLETFSTSGSPDVSLESSTMVQIEGSIYLALQRLDRNDRSGLLPPNSDSLLLEIDPLLDRIRGVYPLPARNPFSRMKLFTLQGEPVLALSCVGNVGFLSQIDGGIVGFRIRSKTFLPNFLYAEATAKGDILTFDILNEETGFASVLDSGLNKRVQMFRPLTGEFRGNLLEIPGNVGNSITALAIAPDGKLLVGSTDFRNPGLLLFDINQNNRPLVNIPVPVELTPSQILLLQNPN